MKTLKHLILIMISAAGLASCSMLGSLDDLEFEYVRTDENIITDAASAENQLAGVYSQWKPFNVSTFFTLQSLRSGAIATANIDGYTEFQSNQITDTNNATEKVYTNLYLIINAANSLVAALDARPEIKGLSETRRAEIRAEAYFNKALAEYYLLCTFGEFYDLKSKYGIVIWNEPVRGTVARARESVAGSYAAILADLEAALQVPATPALGHAGLNAVRALQAKVLLCMQDYPEAARVAGELIEANDAALESDFLAPFANPYGSAENLFNLYCTYPEAPLGTQYVGYYGTPGEVVTALADELVGEAQDGQLSTPNLMAYYNWLKEQIAVDPSFETLFINSVNEMNYGYTSYTTIQDIIDEYLMYGMSEQEAIEYGVAPYIPPITEEKGIETGIAPSECNASGYDYRYIQTYDPVLVQGECGMSKYIYNDYTAGPNNTLFLLRMADVYYIKAEAEARQGGEHLTAARNALARVLERAHYDRAYVDGIADDRLIEMIHKHRYMENFTENQDDYFDQVRAFKLDGRNFCSNSRIAAGKSLIAPLPRAALGGNNLLEQLP